jgi:small-conductance mechanosensitive channel
VQRSAFRFFDKGLLQAVLLGALCGATSTVAAQEPGGQAEEPRHPAGGSVEDLSPVLAQVNVTPVAHDEEIRTRLQSVLDATGWFTDPRVEVREGVVFLNGPAETVELKEWAGDLARSTQDVVAVANRMEVAEPSVWDFNPAWSGLRALLRDFVRSLPVLSFWLVILALSAGAGVLVTRGARALLRRRVRANLLRSVMARGMGVLVFLFGFYIVLRVSGLTQLALTVVGGTGLIGLALGIAFRDITENFLASIFLSGQRPFETGDLVEVTGVTGYVQQLNVRTTILMTLEGNLVQIPNASVYKNNLRNFTANANRREDFVVGIGYDDSINEAQEIARKVLADHPAVLSDPEPWVLADSLGRATINLRVYFWLNGREHSWVKVRSSVIRLVKLAFQQRGISMPDEAREVIFPQGIPVTMLDREPGGSHDVGPVERSPAQPPRDEPDVASTQAEGGLSSEAGVIKEQARKVQPLNDGENLLAVPSGTPPADGEAKNHGDDGNEPGK